MSGDDDTFDDFLNHSGQDRNSKFLDKWKKEKGHLDTWMHKRRPPRALWGHQFPIIRVKDDQGTSSRMVHTTRYVCHETEALLKKQYKFDANGRRSIPPECCPIDRMNEVIRNFIIGGKLQKTDPVFKFEGDDPNKAIILHAGGMLNMFSGKVSEALKIEMNKKGIYGKDAWKENALAKLQYVFVIVDNEHVSDGLQIAVETSLLGDKVKMVVHDIRMDLGDEEGSPVINPYAIRWQYRKDEAEFSKKYHAVALRKIPLTPEIDELISSEPPDISGICKPFDVAMFRPFVEKHCLIDMPWDDIFRGHDATSTNNTYVKPSGETTRTPEVNTKPSPAPQAAPPTTSSPAVNPEDLYECEVCHKGSVGPEKCDHCGAEYDPANNYKLKPKVPKPMRQRGAIDKKDLKEPGF